MQRISTSFLGHYKGSASQFKSEREGTRSEEGAPAITTHLEVSTADKQVNHNTLRSHNMGDGIVYRFKLSMSTTFDRNLKAGIPTQSGNPSRNMR